MKMRKNRITYKQEAAESSKSTEIYKAFEGRIYRSLYGLQGRIYRSLQGLQRWYPQISIRPSNVESTDLYLAFKGIYRSL